MAQDKIVFVYITFPNSEEAQKVGRILLEKRLCGCVNLFTNINSMYWWEGKIEVSQEAVLIVKTRESLYPEVEKEVLKNHSYSCPCIAKIEVSEVTPCFYRWLLQETGVEI
ncbi:MULTISPECIES: divalent-cation tolerance protein CutA [Thermodesulfobacterium]|jgi:periplasmic divalent cation tolerance protein|uniref:Dihydroorotate dehydrogenase n=2 Tax=Thermodesulfobacterium commune TaxID=1741 RepID=A0A075WRI2_9BACT|nr:MULTISPECIES: divalent-cation tolerance protein CutA [Thermodesulfobacterium]KUJ98312.1 MAG: CutA1 divalent ion tolerance protein [Thermodesulfobacterium sp. 37_54]KUK19903.1 MAG: CutA1 divalent ion tolerance protein [Thermodesulfobacterium commune]AIH03924.1 dihydroorotate dehydrogenase [Thermodesulfobacterium commune DSM 2178]KUK38314.1 MAG: CutA1 divalent ion tolerance protein [Thermodesulfobacterium commune]MBZ4681801.1 dihydroorotate dehydrogenase [Thermodesulfobacterium sp.]